jgi:O-succinylbenzoic acid--CoA ligase
MSNRGLLTVTATDGSVAITALRSALAGEATVAVLPSSNTPRTQAVIAAIAPQLPVSDEIALIATTSGSTGNPKAVLLSHAAVMASISAVNTELGFTPQWHLVLPLQHIAGTMTALRGLAANSTLHQPTINAADPMQLAAYSKSVKDLSGLHAIALVPEHLNRLEVIGELGALKHFHKVVVGAGALDLAMKSKLMDYGIAVVSSYGLTETCGGIVWDGLPLNSVAISLNQANEVLIQSEMNATSYRDDLNELTIINTHDIGDLSSGKLQIKGRSDSKVKVKGHFVDLNTLTQLTTELTGLQAVAFVVADQLHLVIEGSKFDHSDLASRLNDELGSAVKGCKIGFREKFPRTDLGKIDMFAMRLELTSG